MQEYAIIVAGGSGSRMKSDIPKQFLPHQASAHPDVHDPGFQGLFGKS
jgi:bifunctional N-acetylglucosamine-1-phosphate-uridyltransferase/glucosamine-1-phosphate-acetyltransferase GlmU-like protein